MSISDIFASTNGILFVVLVALKSYINSVLIYQENLQHTLSTVVSGTISSVESSSNKNCWQRCLFIIQSVQHGPWLEKDMLLLHLLMLFSNAVSRGVLAKISETDLKTRTNKTDKTCMARYHMMSVR